MKEIKSAFGYFYGVCDVMTYSLRYRIVMNDEVDGKTLSNSVQKTMDRYSYLKMKMVRKGGIVQLAENTSPVAVVHSEQSIVPGSKGANEHLISFNCYEKNICINAFHGIVDGKALIEISKTLLFYYCSEKYGCTAHTDGIRLLGDQKNPLEYTDPMDTTRPQHDNILQIKNKKEKKRKSLSLSKNFRGAESKYFYLKIPESELMEFCRSNDASPNTFFSVVLARAIHGLDLSKNDEITESICVDQRPALNLPESLMSLVSTCEIAFPEKFFHYDFGMQCTIFRGKLMIATDIDHIGEKIEGTYKFYRLMSKIPTLHLKRKLMGTLVKNTVTKNTFMVSYSGPTYLGELSQYVDAAYVETEPAGIGVEISAVAGNFDIVFSQAWADRKVYLAFLKELDALNVNYSLVDECTVDLLKFKYPV